MLTGRSVVAVAVFASLTGSFARGAAAQDARPRHLYFELGAFGGVFIPDEEHEFVDDQVAQQEPLKQIGPDMGIHLAFFPLSWLGIEGEGSAVLTKTDESNGTVNLFSGRGSLVLQIPFRVTPFILGGAGNTWTVSEDDVLGNDTDVVFHGGAGLKIFATRGLQFRLEGRVYLGDRLDPADPTKDNDYIPHFGALGGITWAIGGRRSDTGEEDPDPDGDGFVAPEDKCPTQKGVEPDGCPAKDSDGDGLNDSADKCPKEPETVNGHEDTDGCPDDEPDADEDGISGAADKCEDEPEDKDGFNDDDGCPEADNDEDGLADADDMCPEQDGPNENRGCPDSDKDGDGVVDRLDNCPDQPGRSTFKGCSTKQLVSITPSQLKVFRNVQFGSGGTSIARRSRKLLDQVANVIRAHPEFVKVRIEGHTDDRGGDDSNKALSQQRAQAVTDYLISRGVEAKRLEAVGFGEEKPLFSNRTASGRKKNRRVEFNLEDVRPPGSKPGKSGSKSSGGDKSSGDKSDKDGDRDSDRDKDKDRDRDRDVPETEDRSETMKKPRKETRVPEKKTDEVELKGRDDLGDSDSGEGTKKK
jgi:outer membrane protein OmpA-like peptidoglycan-associated protein